MLDVRGCLLWWRGGVVAVGCRKEATRVNLNFTSLFRCSAAPQASQPPIASSGPRRPTRPRARRRRCVCMQCVCCEEECVVVAQLRLLCGDVTPTQRYRLRLPHKTYSHSFLSSCYHKAYRYIDALCLSFCFTSVQKRFPSCAVKFKHAELRIVGQHRPRSSTRLVLYV